MVRRLFLALTALALAGCALAPREYPHLATPRAMEITPLRTVRPLVGLVLGAGGSRGFAHVGVIKTLEAAGIEPHVIVGSSSGSVVASLYAGGLSSGALETMALSVADHELIDFTLFGPGKIQGEALQDYVNRALDNRSIEALPRAFAVVATALPQKRMTVFNRGNTGLAVRASSSIPDVFWPVLIDGVHYADGGLVSRVPVAVARAMGAEVVIAVDISWRGTREVEAADVVIRPLTPRTRFLDFSAKRESIAAGEAAALLAIPEIRSRIAQVEAERRAPSLSAVTQ
jgi:NTE family protein